MVWHGVQWHHTVGCRGGKNSVWEGSCATPLSVGGYGGVGGLLDMGGSFSKSIRCWRSRMLLSVVGWMMLNVVCGWMPSMGIAHTHARMMNDAQC